MKNSYPTTAFDCFNYIAQDYNSNALIQFVLKFDETLDYSLLLRALENAITVDPILGCVFSVRDDQPQWEIVPQNISEICRHIDTTDLDAEIFHFLSERIDVRMECPVKMALIIQQDKTVLGIKLHHALCDAGGALQFVQLLANNYSKLLLNAYFVPRIKNPKRGTEDFYDFFGVKDKGTRFKAEMLPDMQSTWGTPVGDSIAVQSFACQQLRIDSKCLLRIRQFAQKQESSLNAVITAAYYRALVNILHPSEATKEMQFSVNMRPFTKNQSSNSLCNLSNMFNVKLPTQAAFEDLVKMTKLEIDKILEPEIILQSVLACELMSDFKALKAFYAADWEQVKSSGLCTPMISNVGKLDNEPISFGNQQPKDMYIVSPSFVGPSFMLAVSSYNGIMTLCSAYYKPSTSDDFVNKLLQTMGEILINL